MLTSSFFDVPIIYHYLGDVKKYLHFLFPECSYIAAVQAS